MLSALGLDVSESDRANMDACYKHTHAEIPAGLSGIFDKKINHTDVIDPSEMKAYVIEKSHR